MLILQGKVVPLTALPNKPNLVFSVFPTVLSWTASFNPLTEACSLRWSTLNFISHHQKAWNTGKNTFACSCLFVKLAKYLMEHWMDFHETLKTVGFTFLTDYSLKLAQFKTAMTADWQQKTHDGYNCHFDRYWSKVNTYQDGCQVIV